MDNVPVRVNGSAPAGRHTEAPGGADQNNKPKRRLQRIGLVGAAAALVVVVVLAGWLIYRSSMAAVIDGSKYQAVFFTNGQVYFGKLQNLNGEYFKLTDVFYLQTQSNDNSKNPQDANAQDANNMQLVKLGNEIHGPEDEMVISKKQVLFFENLKKDGKVSDSISKYASQRK